MSAMNRVAASESVSITHSLSTDLTGEIAAIKNATSEVKLIVMDSTAALGNAVARHLNVQPVDIHLGTFNDGEVDIDVRGSIRGRAVYIIGSTCKPVNDNLMKLYLMVRCLRRAGAFKVTAVVPYIAYSRADTKTQARKPVAAADVAMMLEAAGVDRVISIDLHSAQIQGFYQFVPIDNLPPSIVFTPYLLREVLTPLMPSVIQKREVIVVAASAKGVFRAQAILDGLESGGWDAKLGVLIRGMREANMVMDTPEEIVAAKASLRQDMVGKEAVPGAACIIVDDIAFTGTTLRLGAEALKGLGAAYVVTVCTHPVLSAPDSHARLGASADIDAFVTTDSVPIPANAAAQIGPKLHVVSLDFLLGEAVARSYLAAVDFGARPDCFTSTPSYQEFQDG